MDHRIKLFICLIVVVIGISYYSGIVTRSVSIKIEGVVLTDLGSSSTMTSSKLPKVNREPEHKYVPVKTDDLSLESIGGPSPGVARQDSAERREQSPGNTLNVAIFTINPYWLFRFRFTQSTPVVYRCPNTSRMISMKSAYQNVTLTHGADVVIFARSIDYRLWDQVQAEREPHQVWVYGSEESAYKSPQVRDGDRPVGFGNFRFNMSFGYHSMSDVLVPYGEYTPFGDESEKNFLPPAFSKQEQKTKLIAWVSSHCDMQQWDRLGFVQELSKFVHIDKFGKCGNLTLPGGAAGDKKLKSYKFYLALENSCCREYITEKFWKSLTSYGAVPVVIGAKRDEYEKVAPPNSFIFVDDFDSMSDLAGYLDEVGKNKSLYRQFHQWRRTGVAKQHEIRGVSGAFGSEESACALLEFLEERAWKDSPLEMSFDPYGPKWLGSCKVCSEKAWQKSFDLNSDAYNSTMRALSVRPEYYMRGELEKHRRQIAKQYMDQLDRRKD